eukprot:m.232094 g.232094  ORF g.232094 m.232094 type:complete len:647 (+) comp15708_c0_seq1:230-2170(+)
MSLQSCRKTVEGHNLSRTTRPSRSQSVTFIMPNIWLALCLVLCTVPPVSATVYSVARSDGFLREINPVDGSTIALLSMATNPPNPVSVAGANALTQNPISEELYAVVTFVGNPGPAGNMGGSGGPRVLVSLAIISTQTPRVVVTEVGPLAQKISSITFDSTGQMYALSGSGASTPNTLFRVSTTDGTLTHFFSFTVQNRGGEAMAFNAADGFLYHMAGVFPRALEVVDLSVPAIVSSLNASSGGATTGMTSDGAGGFFLSELFIDQFQSMTAAGIVTDRGPPMDHEVTGLIVLVVPSTSPTTTPTTSPTASPSVSPTTIIAGRGCRAHRHCSPISWCRNDSVCIVCNIPGIGDLCSPEFSATGVCPGKCGTLPPTSTTPAPVPRPSNFCFAHRQCPTNQFCNSTRRCEFCASCSSSSSSDGVCPFKCLSIIAQNVPTPPTFAPSASPTAAPTSSAPVPAPIVAGCRNHRNCPLTHFCAGPIGRCLGCANCIAGSGGNSINSRCPNKCVLPSSPVNGCERHYHCAQDSFCHGSIRECVPCLYFGSGATLSNCSSAVSITGICPAKCLSVLNPSRTTSGGSSPNADGGSGPSQMTILAVVFSVSGMAAVVAIVIARRLRKWDARQLNIDLINSATAPPLPKLAWDNCQ